MHKFNFRSSRDTSQTLIVSSELFGVRSTNSKLGFSENDCCTSLLSSTDVESSTSPECHSHLCKTEHRVPTPLSYVPSDRYTTQEAAPKEMLFTVRTLIPPPLSPPPIPPCRPNQVIYIQDINTFPDKYMPNMVPQSPWPGWKAPIPDL